MSIKIKKWFGRKVIPATEIQVERIGENTFRVVLFQAQRGNSMGDILSTSERWLPIGEFMGVDTMIPAHLPDDRGVS